MVDIFTLNGGKLLSGSAESYRLIIKLVIKKKLIFLTLLIVLLFLLLLLSTTELHNSQLKNLRTHQINQ